MTSGAGAGRARLGPKELAFRARALAQAHPLTPLAQRFVTQAIEEQRVAQPLAESAEWAGSALLNGYCLRRVEEDDAGLSLDPQAAVALSVEALDEAAGRAAAELRAGGATTTARFGDDKRIVAALDRIIASELDRRRDGWRDEIDDAAWAELEEYVTWWVVKGYALRVAELTRGALA